MTSESVKGKKMANRPLQKELRSTKIDIDSSIKLDWRNPTDKKIYKFLAKKGPLTRTELAKETGLSRSTLFDVLNRLMIRGLIERFSEERQTRGRPKVFFMVPQ